MRKSETAREGITVMTLHVKEDERIKRLRERREQREQQQAKDEQERLERKAKHDKKKKAKQQNKPEEVIEKEEQKQRDYDERQDNEQYYDEQQDDETDNANIIVKEGLYRLNIEVTVKNIYGEDEIFEMKNDEMMIEEKEITDDFVMNLIEITEKNLEENENFDDSIRADDVDKDDIASIRDFIIKSWRNDEVPKIRLG